MSLPLARRPLYRQFVGDMVSRYITLDNPRHLLGYNQAGIFDTFLKLELRPTPGALP